MIPEKITPALLTIRDPGAKRRRSSLARCYRQRGVSDDQPDKPVRRKIYLCCILWGEALLALGLLVSLLTLLAGHTTAGEFDHVPAAAERMAPLWTLDKTTLHSTNGVVITGGLTVADVRTYPQGLTVRTGLTVTGKLTVTNGLTVGKHLIVSGRMVVTGGLAVAVWEGSPVTANPIITKGLTVTDGKTIMGGLIVTDGLTVTGDLTVFGGLRVTGRVTVTGRLIVRANSVYLPVIIHYPLIEAANGNFELGSTQWDEFSKVGQPLIRPASALGVSPHSGQWAARLGNYDNEISLISQGVSIARDSACLVFWQWTVSNDTCNTDYGGVGINGKWVDVHTLCAGTATAQWVRRQVSMTRYVTTTSVLNFAVTNDYSAPSTMYIDDISFQATALCASSEQNREQSVQPAASLVGQSIVDRTNEELP